ncbi:hypothetical protein D8I24_0475 (plasmid) [Cupriavidus necator H850]|nr:hypothetical protein D8I24_0475 [Cupriavidus necator H850]
MGETYLLGDSGLGKKWQALAETKKPAIADPISIERSQAVPYDACELSTNTNEDGVKPAQRSPYR